MEEGKAAGSLPPAEDELQKFPAEAELCRRGQVTEEYILHTQAELDALIHQAEVRGRVPASRVNSECPVITVTSIQGEGEPHSIVVGAGGV